MKKGARVEGGEPLPPLDVDRSRLEFLFDGVFAIAMTLLVLELKVPELADTRSVKELISEIGHHGAAFLSYCLSFAMLGILWHNHQRQYRFIRRVTRGIFIANLILMATAAAFPFCAALFGRYPFNGFSVVLYLVCLFVHMAASYAQWRLAERAGALSPDLEPARAAKFRRGALVGSLVLGSLALTYLALVLSGL
jgi:uncharacterized membrane protein